MQLISGVIPCNWDFPMPHWLPKFLSFFKDVIVDEIRQLTKRTNSIMYPTQHFQRIYDMCSEFTVVIITS